MLKVKLAIVCCLLAIVGSSQPPNWIIHGGKPGGQGLGPPPVPGLQHRFQTTVSPYHRKDPYKEKPDSESPANGQIVQSFHVSADIRHRFATTTVTSFVFNPNDKVEELTFDLTLPKQAFIMHFDMEIDNKTYDGEVKERKEAKHQYQAAVDRGESAGHVRQAARHANLFSVSAAAAARSGVKFTLTFQQLLRRSRGLYEYVLHVAPKGAVDDFRVTVDIQEKQPLKFVRTPALRTDELISNEIEAANSLTVIERPTPSTAHVTYQPSVNQQGEGGVNGKFVVQYDVMHKPKGEVLVADGYFVHFYAPELPPMPKDIIFVLDVSGSMTGSKIRQLKQAMGVILGDLEKHDRFNILTFSTDVTRWKEGLVDAGEKEVALAQTFVEGMSANGMTNIDMALTSAVDELRNVEAQRAGLVFFLTDGEPTRGEQNMGKIAEHVRRKNEHEAVIISLAFGGQADFSALKAVSGQNSGFARKIYEASDAALQVARLYSEVSTIVMRNLQVTYLPSAVDAFTVTDTQVPVVFNGTEVVICGGLGELRGGFAYDIQYTNKAGTADISWATDDVSNLILRDVTDQDVGDVIDLDLDGGEGRELEGEATPTRGPRDFAGLIERMWAHLTVAEMLKQREKQQEKDSEEANQFKKKIIDLAIKYQLVTPLTSMVVTRPDSDRKSTAELQDADNVIMGLQRPKMAASGSQIVYARGPVGAVPHRGGRRNKAMMYDPMPNVMAGLPGLSHASYAPQPLPDMGHGLAMFPTRPTTTSRSPLTSTPDMMTSSVMPASGAPLRPWDEILELFANVKNLRKKTPLLTHMRLSTNLPSDPQEHCVVLRKVKAGKYLLLQTTVHNTTHGTGRPGAMVFDTSKAGSGPASPCGSGGRMCRGVKKCVPLARVCDGRDDCGDASDEAGCGAGDNGGRGMDVVEAVLTAHTGCPRGNCKKVTLEAMTLTVSVNGGIESQMTFNFSSGAIWGLGPQGWLRNEPTIITWSYPEPRVFTLTMQKDSSKKPRVRVAVRLYPWEREAGGITVTRTGLLGDIFQKGQQSSPLKRRKRQRKPKMPKKQRVHYSCRKYGLLSSLTLRQRKLDSYIIHTITN